MLILGAKSLAKEVLEILYQKGETQNLCFYDDITPDFPDKLYNQFRVLKNETEAKNYFTGVDENFTIGIGDPILRYKLFVKFSKLMGTVTSAISKYADIGSFNVEIGKGCNIFSGVKISNDVKIDEGTLIHYNCIIPHDVEIGKFVEISPGAILLGRSKVGDFATIGAGAIIFPDIKIGNNAIVGAGAVVRADVPDSAVVVGIPARIIKTNNLK